MEIQLSELQKLLTKSKDINTTINQELTKMNTTLEEICQNINSTELPVSNKKLANAITDVSKTVKNNLPELIEYISNKITSYETTNEGNENQINSQ